MITQIPPVIIALIGVLGLTLLPRRPGHLTAILSLLSVAAISLTVDHGTHLAFTMFGTFDAVLFMVDDFTALMGLIFSVIGAGAVLYAYSSGISKYATAFATAYAASGIGAVFAGDWLTLIFFWELMAVASTLLVWHHGGKAVRSGFRYAIAHGIGGSLLLFAIIWHFANTGSMIFAETGIAAGWPSVLAAIGIGVNVGFVGLHSWLPDTYPSPHIAASVFLCVYTTKAGVYGMYRAFPEGHIWIAHMGGAMAVFGAFYALFQHDMRRLLSYHIQSQVGYMIAGVGLGTSLAVAGAFGHIFNHILYKGLLFMAVGVIIYRTGESDLYKLEGSLWKAMPLTLVAFAVGALSITGVPGFNGFVSKGIIISQAHKEHLTAVYWLLMIGAIGTFLSFLKLGYYAFFYGSRDSSNIKDAKIGQTLSMFTMAGLCILFGIWWTGLIDLLPSVPHHPHLHPYSLSHVGEVLALAGISIVSFKLIRNPLSRVSHVPDIDSLIYPGIFRISQISARVTTKAYSMVDQIVVSAVELLYVIGNNPAETAVYTVQKLPNRVLADHITVDKENPSRLTLRPGIGASILILCAVLTLAIFVII